MAQKRFQRVLLVNDDGVDAPGIRLLERGASELAKEVWIVAPATDKSGVSNSLSLREPVRVERKGERKYAVHGTPADCVTFAVKSLMKETPPDLLLSGVNCGSNIGFETVLSGTVGAAMTGVLSNILSVALSQDKKQEESVNWQASEALCLPVLQKLLSLDLPGECCFNINFPNLPPATVKGIKICSQGMGKVKGVVVTPARDPFGEEYFWVRVEHGQLNIPAGSELEAINDGYVSITPLTFERTSREGRAQLEEQLPDIITF